MPARRGNNQAPLSEQSKYSTRLPGAKAVRGEPRPKTRVPINSYGLPKPKVKKIRRM